MSVEAIRVPAERKQLAFIRDFVAEQAVLALPDGNVSRPVLDDLIQAVDEAATNIIVHGYRDGPGEIEIKMETRPDKLVVALLDRAPLFDPTRVPPPDLTLPLELRPVGGLGIHLIRQCVDIFIHRAREDGGNELILVKNLQRER